MVSAVYDVDLGDLVKKNWIIRKVGKKAIPDSAGSDDMYHDAIMEARREGNPYDIVFERGSLKRSTDEMTQLIMFNPRIRVGMSVTGNTVNHLKLIDAQADYEGVQPGWTIRKVVDVDIDPDQDDDAKEDQILTAIGKCKENGRRYAILFEKTPLVVMFEPYEKVGMVLDGNEVSWIGVGQAADKNIKVGCTILRVGDEHITDCMDKVRSLTTGASIQSVIESVLINHRGRGKPYEIVFGTHSF